MKNSVRSLFRVAFNLVTGSRSLSRAGFLSRIPMSGNVLEIGPFTNPDLRGKNVAYFDVLDKAGLLHRAKAENYPIADPEAVPEIDYVSPTGDLSIIAGPFDTIYSAHCIEHQPDLIGHLQEVERLLSPGGRYYITMPDKRYCFDAHIAPSDLAQVVAQHIEASSVHSLSNVIRYYSLTTHNNSMRHWLGQHGEPGSNAHLVQQALHEYEQSQGGYLDVHAWRFTPSSLATIISQLNKIGYIGLRLVNLYPTTFGANEFYAVLEK